MIVDSQHPVDKLRQKSKTIMSNGLNPVWNQSFEFKIEYPELAMLHIGVYHQVLGCWRGVRWCIQLSRACMYVCVSACVSVGPQADIGRDNMLAHFAAPIQVLRVGYRSCPLRNKLGKRIPFCNLLCMFSTKGIVQQPGTSATPVM